ncbi:hypothetical protein [Bartonella sp. B41]
MKVITFNVFPEALYKKGCDFILSVHYREVVKILLKLAISMSAVG